MKKQLRYLLGAFLLVGVFISCETTDPMMDDAQINIYAQNFDSAHAILDRSIQQNPENGVPYYYKALAYAQEAGTLEDPSERPPLYRNFREAVTTSRTLFEAVEEKPDEAELVTNLVLGTWSEEHNTGIQYATDDSVMASVDNPLDIAIAHLKNAVIVNPDSTLSFDVLSQIHYMNNDFEGAIEALEQSMVLKNPAPPEDYQRLSAFYASTDQMEETISTLKKALELYPDSTLFSQNLADAYMQSGNRDASIEILEQLIEDEPDNVQYRLALGTQLLQATTVISDKMSEIYNQMYDLRDELRGNSSQANRINSELDGMQDQIDELTEEINELAALAEEELQYALNLSEDQPIAYNALGVIYQNKAAALFDRRNYILDNDESAQYDAQAREALREAMGYYEKVVEYEPENRSAWQSLASIYYQLDMVEKAQDALDKAQ